MPNDLVPAQGLGQLPASFANQTMPDDLGAGIVGGYGVVSIRGKAWRIKHGGVEQVLMRDDGDGPVSSIECVIIGASPRLSKIYYAEGYSEGSNERPDCYSTNGIVPDPAAASKQSPACASCPQNAWGSRVTPAGKPGRACSDNKRVAIVPLIDIENVNYGGPMLLRIPPASLTDVANYAAKMKSLGYPYYAIGTRIAFDIDAEYPKLIFSAIRALTEDEAQQVIAVQQDPRTARILSEASEFAAPTGEVAEEQVFEQQPAPKPAPAKSAPVATAKPVAAKPAPVAAKSAPAAKPTPALTAAAAKPSGGFGKTQPVAGDDPGDIPTGLKRTPAAKPKPTMPPVTEPDPEGEEEAAAEEGAVQTGATDFDSQLDALLS